MWKIRYGGESQNNPVMGLGELKMRNGNVPGVYPSILIHRSHNGQLAIGGAMINPIYENDDEAEYRQAAPASGGWRTRFDGGSYDYWLSDLPCHMVAMYVEGLIYIYGGGGGDLGMECDSIEEGFEEGTGTTAGPDQQSVLFQTDTRPD